MTTPIINGRQVDPKKWAAFLAACVAAKEYYAEHMAEGIHSDEYKRLLREADALYVECCKACEDSQQGKPS